MANEVEIRITADDMSGPAFASAMARIKALKAAASGVGFGDLSYGLNDAISKMGVLKQEIDKFTFGKIDTGQLDASLSVLRSRIQSLGIADLADVNVTPGRIMSQLHLLKRMIQQAGISDIMDVNLNEGDLMKQLAKLSGLTETIPVLFDVSKMPTFGDVSPIKVPVTFEETVSGSFGDLKKVINEVAKAEDELATATEGANKQAAEATLYWDGPIRAMEEFGGVLHDDTQYFGGFGSAFSFVDSLIRSGMAYVGAHAVPAMVSFGSSVKATSIALGGAFATSTYMALSKLSGLRDNISLGLPLMSTMTTWFGIKLPTSIELFGGALTRIGIPAFLGTASGLHMIVEASVELLGTAIPAVIGFATAIGAAIPDVTDLKSRMQALYTVTDAFGVSIYPITGQVQKLAQAVQPNVYVMFGEALAVVNSKTDMFTQLASASAKVLNDLGARFVYAVTQSNTFGTIMSHAAADLAGWGNLIGNFGGIFGNVMKVLPGYAEMLLGALNGVTHAIEMLTGSGIGQWFLKIGLAAHGALFYVGLLGTGFAALASKGLGLLATGLARTAGFLGSLGGGFAKAGTQVAGFSIAADRASRLPWGWISIAAAAFGFLIYELLTAKDATQQFFATLQQNASNVSIFALQTTLTAQLSAAQKDLANAESNLSLQQGYLNNIVAGAPYGPATAALAQLSAQVAEYKLGIQGIKQEQAIVNAHIADAAKIFGSTQAAWQALNDAGVTSAQLLDQNKQHWAEAMIEAQAYNDTLRSVTEAGGRFGAAENALNFSLFDTANKLGFAQDTIQKYTQAETALLNVVLGGEQAFVAFQQNIQTTAQDSKKATDGISGLSSASLKLANDVYTTSIPSLQTLINNLNLQEISTSNLTKVVATGAAEMLRYTGNNTAANSVIVSLINNALGPNTVSLQTLNKWVKNNATSMTGFNNIVAQTTINASTLAGVLQTDLNVQFQQALLKSSGADKAVQGLADAIVHNGTSSEQFRSARQRLITDLENAGLSAQQATHYVQGLQNQVAQLKGKAIGIEVLASGTGTVSYQTTSQGTNGFPIVKGNLHFFHSGGLVGGQLGSFGPDDQLAAVRTGEFVVNPEATKKNLPWLRKINSFATGGLVDPVGVLSSVPGGWMQGWGKDVDVTFAKDVVDSFKKQLNTIVTPPGGIGIPGGSANSGYQAFQIIANKLGWGPALLQDWVNVEMREAGFSLTATNPSSGAYGMAQFIQGAGEYYTYGGNPYTYLGQATAMANYILQRYGTPAGAWAHEQAFNWYDNGGWLQPGLTLAYNGTGQPERVNPPGGGTGGNATLEVVGGYDLFERFMAQFIREFVRVKGGGSVQRAFGSMGKKS